MDSEKLQSSLKIMNESLLCAICLEVYVTPVIITACSHNFCSICIRRYFTIKQECPLCGSEASTANLIPNRVIETLIKHFNNLKYVLKSCSVQTHSVSNGDVNHEKNLKNSNAFVSVLEKRKSCNVVDLTEQVVQNGAKSACVADSSQIEATPLFSLGLKEFCTQSQGFPTQNIDLTTKKTAASENSCIVTSQQPNNSDLTDGIGSSNTNRTSAAASQEPTKADCPVCGIEVDTSKINSHLDSCLAREEKKNSLRQNTPKRLKRNNPPTAKLAYNLLSLRDLRKKLKEIGLPTNGDKNDLKRRHQEFLIKYQAEMDKSEPRAVSKVIDELKREETSKKEMEKKQNFVGKLSPTKSTDLSKVNQDYIRHHAKQFKELEEMAAKSLPTKRRKLNSAERKLFEEPTPVAKAATIVDETNNCNSEGIAPDSCLSLATSDEGLIFDKLAVYTENINGGNSPELYVDDPCTSGLNTSKANLKETVEADSQAEEIKCYIDASLSEAY